MARTHKKVRHLQKGKGQNDGMVRRIVHHQVPPRVEYGLTDWGRALCPVLDALLKWAALREEAADGVAQVNALRRL